MVVMEPTTNGCQDAVFGAARQLSTPFSLLPSEGFRVPHTQQRDPLTFPYRQTSRFAYEYCLPD